MTEIPLPSPEATEAFGHALASLIRPGDVLALEGDLGAGKTTLARGILRGLGHEGEVASPTFPIVVPYEELALDDAHLRIALLIEWPERLGGVGWDDALRLRLERRGEGARVLTAQVPPAWGGRWPPR